MTNTVNVRPSTACIAQVKCAKEIAGYTNDIYKLDISELATIAEHICMGEPGGVDGLSNQTHEPTSKNVCPPLLTSPVLEGLPTLLVCYFCQTFLPSRHFFPNCSIFFRLAFRIFEKRTLCCKNFWVSFVVLMVDQIGVGGCRLLV